MPTLRGHDAIQPNVMPLQRKFRSHLTVKSHAALEPGDLCQEPIEKAFPTPQPAAIEAKSYARDKSQVQLL